MDSGLLGLDAIAQATMVRSRQITAVDLVDAAIERMREVNSTLNCVVVDLTDQAHREAKGLRPSSDGEPRPFDGVPILLKDLGQQVAGVRQSDGSRALKDAVATFDSAVSIAYRRAGTILLGKTSAPEFGNHSTTEPVLYGPCRNPWNMSRSAGGSSGGAAVAVAAGIVAVAGASDGAGSIRIPASCCGVFGLKPTRGRISASPDPDERLFGLSTNHVITRSVRDSAAFLDVAAGPVPGDAYWLPRQPNTFLHALDTDPRRLRIAMSTRSPLATPVHSDCSSAAVRTAELMKDMGHMVDEAAPKFDVDALTESMLALWAAGNAATHDAIVQSLGRALDSSELEPTTWELIDLGRSLTAVDIHKALGNLQTASWQIATFFSRYDAWLTPTTAQPAPPLGELNRALGSARAWWDYDLAFNPFNPIANLTGQPSASVPLDWNSVGLPIGTLITGRYGEEGTVLQLAAELERARPWAGRVPTQRTETTGARD